MATIIDATTVFAAARQAAQGARERREQEARPLAIAARVNALLGIGEA